MSHSIQSLSLVVATAVVLAACGAKPATTPGGKSAPLPSADSGAAGSYQGVPKYPGMTELMTHDTPAGPGGTLHSGSYRSNDKAEQIHAYYKEQLGKLYRDKLSDDTLGEGMVRLVSGNDSKVVTILIHPGDSGEQVIGIQVVAKD